MLILLSTVMPSVLIMTIGMLSGILPSVEMPNVLMLNNHPYAEWHCVIILSVTVLIVVAQRYLRPMRE